MSTEGAIWGAVILGLALVVASWLLSSDGYERCLAVHSGNIDRCQRFYPPTAAPAFVATPTPGGASR